MARAPQGGAGRDLRCALGTVRLAIGGLSWAGRRQGRGDMARILPASSTPNGRLQISKTWGLASAKVQAVLSCQPRDRRRVEVEPIARCECHQCGEVRGAVDTEDVAELGEIGFEPGR